MNLHAIVAPNVAAINPMLTVTIQRSTGYTTGGDGTRTPTYATPEPQLAQIQALQYNDLAQISGLNIQGERCAAYLNGNWEGVLRPDGKGGDLITLPDSSVWLVVFVFENWADRDGWVKVCITRQMGA